MLLSFFITPVFLGPLCHKGNGFLMWFCAIISHKKGDRYDAVPEISFNPSLTLQSERQHPKTRGRVGLTIHRDT